MRHCVGPQGRVLGKRTQPRLARCRAAAEVRHSRHRREEKEKEEVRQKQPGEGRRSIIR